uniref:Uncharacterized protein n=1 Tax=Salix viminalis TaxID=40686 RepID=A0A6N2KS62_SALVM
MILATSLFRVVTKNLLPGKQPRLREFSSCSHFVESSFHTSSRTSKNLFPLSDSCILSSKACNSIKSWADPTRASRIALAILISSKGSPPRDHYKLVGRGLSFLSLPSLLERLYGGLVLDHYSHPATFSLSSGYFTFRQIRFRLWS